LEQLTKSGHTLRFSIISELSDNPKSRSTVVFLKDNLISIVKLKLKLFYFNELRIESANLFH